MNYNPNGAGLGQYTLPQNPQYYPNTGVPNGHHGIPPFQLAPLQSTQLYDPPLAMAINRLAAALEKFNEQSGK